MQLVNQFLQFLQQALAAVFRVIEIVWRWSVAQITAVPWNRLSELPAFKVVILAICAGAVAFLIYRAGRELFQAGEKALTAFRAEDAAREIGQALRICAGPFLERAAAIGEDRRLAKPNQLGRKE